MSCRLALLPTAGPEAVAAIGHVDGEALAEARFAKSRVLSASLRLGITRSEPDGTVSPDSSVMASPVSARRGCAPRRRAARPAGTGDRRTDEERVLLAKSAGSAARCACGS